MKAPQFRRSAIAVAITTAFASQLSPASTPVTGEFLVNQLLAGPQLDAQVARAADGRFVVVWTDQQGSDGSGQGIKARVYAADGQPASDEFVVNSETRSTQNQPDVAMEPDGDFVVVWSTYTYPYGTSYDISARRFDATGAPLTGDIVVNNFVSAQQRQPTVAVDADGDFVVAWQSYNQPGDLTSYGIFARQFNAAGTPAANSFKINNQTVGNQTLPDVGSDAAGNFVVAWATPDNSSGGVAMRRFDSAGVALANQVFVSSTQNSNQREPTVAVDADGDIVVAWGDARSTVEGGDYSYNIFARRYNSAGVAQGADFIVNENLSSTQLFPSVAIDADGDFTIAWSSYRLEGAAYSYGISARRFSSGGVAQTSELVVNVFATAQQKFPSVAADADGDFVVAWQSYSQEVPGFAGHYGIFARRYNGEESVDLSISAGGTSTVTPGRAITYTMSGTNNHAAVTPTGIAAIDAAIGLATNVMITDQLPAGTEFLSASGTNWTCDNAGTDVTCSFAPLLAPQATTNTLTIRALAPEAEADDTLVNSPEILAEQSDSTPANNTQDVTTSVVCNPGTISLSVASANFSEGSGTAAIAVVRSGGTCGAASVSFATSNGTAQTFDYTDSDTTLNWASNEGGSKIVNVPINTDPTDEADETVNLTLSGVTGASLGSIASGSFTIVDDDNPVVSFSSSAQSVGEAVGVVTLTAETTVKSNVNLVLKLKRTGTASPADLDAVPTTLVIPAGAFTGTATFTGVNDTRFEPTGNTAIFTISSVTSRATLGTTKVHTVNIGDNDPVPAVSFDVASHTLNEIGTRNVRVQLDRQSDETVSVDFAESPSSTATLNVDYTRTLASPIVFSPGETSKTLKFVVVEDTATEPAESAIYTLTVPANASAGANLTYSLNINASD